MKTAFSQVEKFNRKVLGIDVKKRGLLPEEAIHLSFHQLTEEADELLEAHDANDYIGAVDAAIDSIFFAMGILYKLGVTEENFDTIFEVVSEANMAKVKGKARGRESYNAADATKPEGWVSPEETIARILGDSSID